MHLLKLLKDLLRSQDGASAVEYAILISGIAALLIAPGTALGQTLNGLDGTFVLP